MRTEEPAKWFRLYAEFASDPKVQMLSEINQRRYLMTLCLRCSNGNVTLQDEEVAFQLRISNDDWNETKAVLVGKGLIDKSNKPTNWEKRQRDSDSSAARVAAYRERKKQECNVTVTPQRREEKRREENKEKEKEKEKIQKEKPAQPSVSRPQDVSEQTWVDWLALRKAKKAPVTQTVIDKAIGESQKAKLPLEDFLKIWCARGSQGLEASWLKPNETQQTKKTGYVHDLSQMDYTRGVDEDGNF